MRRSLFLKFILAYLIFGILSFGLVSTVSAGMIYRQLLAERTDKMYHEAVLIADTYSQSGSAFSEAAIRRQLKTVALFLDMDIWVIDREGNISLDTAEQYQGRIFSGFEPVAQSQGRYIVQAYPDFFDGEVITVFAPLTRSYSNIGYVLIHLPKSRIVREQQLMMQSVYLSGVLIFLLSLMILLVFYFIVYRPLRSITEGATQYAAGKYSYKIKNRARDEMGYLAGTLNFMSDEINKVDEYQKQFIANISHDFRSPLTSIKGYLEAILDGTIPVESQEKYLRRMISETERLKKLTESILSLSSMEQRGFLNRSKFDINRVIKDSCASFEMSCGEKNIIFELNFMNKLEMVYADYGKIQQVLYNLIDNAIKFSHTDTSIQIQSTVRGNKVYVSVKDSGIGIPKEAIGKIWDRFYKTDLSRGKNKQGTGLGLSIVKSIISAHEEMIDVVSTEGAGTVFTFTLPCAPEE